MNTNNPAARLHTILTRCRHKDLRPKKMMTAWTGVLGLADDVEETIVMSKVGKVFVLPSKITTEIKQFDDLDLELYLGWQNDLSQAFQNINFHSQFNGFADKLSDSLLMNIRFCAHELEKRRPEKLLSPKDLDKLKTAAYSLYTDVVAAKLDPNISRYLLDHIYMIIEAIDDYLINGSSGLITSFNAIVGTVITTADVAKAARDSQFGDRFWDLATKVALTIEFSRFAKEIGDGLCKLLP